MKYDLIFLDCENVVQYKINYVDIDIQQGFDKLLTTFLVERKKFI
jgi:hypothetical protein